MKIRVAGTLAVAMTAVLAAGLSACGGGTPATTPASSGTIPLLRAGIPFPLPTLDETKDLNVTFITELGLETLLKYGPQGQLEPVLATSWAQTSPVSYVYHLRHGVKFWDGHPLTATDVAYSLNYDRAPGSETAFAFTDVKAITATDPYTVTVTLTQPDASWQYVPAELNSEIFEQRFQQAHKTAFGQPGTLTMGTGPWIVNSLDPTKGAQLSANPHWWGGTAPIQRISFTFFSSETSEALAFRADEIDIDPVVDSPKNFAATSGATLLTTASCGNGFFSMNVSQAGWNDVHVRRAVAYAINRPDIIAAHGGYAQPLYTLTPPSLLRSVASQAHQQGSFNVADYAPPAVDTLLAQGAATTSPAQRFAAYSQLFRRLQSDLPYIGLFTSDSTIALSPRFSYPDYGQWYWDLPWALGIRPA